MISLVAFLAVFVALVSVRAAPSSAPTCSYICPSVDAFAYSVGVHYNCTSL